MPTPLPVAFTFLNFIDFSIFYHFGRSSYDLSLNTMMVAWRVLTETRLSWSLGSIWVLMMFSKVYRQESIKGIWMKCVKPFSLSGGLGLLLIKLIGSMAFIYFLLLVYGIGFFSVFSSWIGLFWWISFSGSYLRLHYRLFGSIYFCLYNSIISSLLKYTCSVPLRLSLGRKNC